MRFEKYSVILSILWVSAVLITANPTGAAGWLSASSEGSPRHTTIRRNTRGHGIVPAFTATFSFGSIRFDPIPGIPPPIPSPVPSGQPLYPLWADGEWSSSGIPTTPPCTNDATAAPEIFADDPETWNSTTWGSGHSAARIELGALGPPIGSGLVFVYFLNKLGATAHLNLAASGPAGSTFLFYAPGVQVSASTPYPLTAAHASEQFLKAYTSGSTSGFTKVTTATTPTRFFSYTVSTNDLVAGELDTVGVANATTFYIYADDTSTPAPYSAGYPIGDDGLNRRGFFRGAHFTIEHGLSDVVEDNRGGESFWDVTRPTPSPGMTPLPNSVDVCQTPLPGIDGIKGGLAVTLTANFGVPVQIHGQPFPVGEYWFLDPRGNTGFATAMYVSNMKDPHTHATVPPGVYALPTTYPGASPQPSTVPSPLGESISLGFDDVNLSRTLIWVQSGGNAAPVRFWYLVPAF